MPPIGSSRPFGRAQRSIRLEQGDAQELIKPSGWVGLVDRALKRRK